MKAINQYCPRSGKAVSLDSVTVYRYFPVGFCNPGCMNDFQENINERPEDRKYFDVLIKELGLEKKSGPKFSLARANLIDFMITEKDR